MNWNQIRHQYPHQWLLVEAIKAHTEGNRRRFEELAVIDAYPDSAAAMQGYLSLHRQAPARELYMLHTDQTELDITERRWVGIRQSL